MNTGIDVPLPQRVVTFLTDAVGGDETLARRCYITGFKEDPAGDYDSKTRARMWSGGTASVQAAAVQPEDNLYLAISTFNSGDDGRVRRRQALHDRTLFIMIDDVGTGPSAKVDPACVRIAPTWAVETSPGNAQYWYRIAPAATDAAAVERVINALVSKGLAKEADPGMKGVTRYGRLPFGVNSKARYRLNGHPQGFPVELIADCSDMTREYSLEAFAAAWGIEDALVAPPAAPTPAPLTGTPGVDEFNAALLESLAEYGPSAKSGCSGAYRLERCPFADKHGEKAGADGAAVWLIGATDGTERYERGAFKCHHGHGDQDKWRELLAKLGLAERFSHVEAVALYGEAEVAAFKAESLAIGEGEEPGDPVALRRRLPAEMDLAAMLQRFVMLESSGAICDIERPKLTMTPQTFTAVLAHNITYVPTLGLKGPGVVEIPTTKQWAKSKLKTVAFTTTFHPGAPIICQATEEGRGYDAVNLWRPPEAHNPPANWPERLCRFTAHMEYLIPVESERERFLDWLAHLEQRPGERPHSHYLMIATQTGIGRSYLGSLLARVMPGYVALNFRLVQSLASGFNGRLSAKLLAVVDELNEGGATGDRWAHSEVLKSLLTEEHLHINPKYGSEHTEMNCLRFLAFSNHVTALPLDTTDRRWWVVRNPSEPRDKAYYRQLYDELKDPAFICSVREWLRRRDLARFNPFERPALNLAKRELVNASGCDEEERMDAIVAHCPADVVPTPLLMEWIFGVMAVCSVSSRPDLARKMGARLNHMLARHGGGAYVKRLKLDGKNTGISILRRTGRWREASADAIRDEVARLGDWSPDCIKDEDEPEC